MSIPHELRDLVPVIGQEIASAVGWESTEMVLSAFRGRIIYVPTGAHKSASRYKELVEVLGEDVAQRLVKVFAGESIDIPRCMKPCCAMRDRQIRAEFDKLIKSMSQRRAVDLLISKHPMTNRNMQRILCGTDV